MKFTVLHIFLGALSVLEYCRLVDATAQFPTQTFFVPLPEKDVFDNTFMKVNKLDAAGPVISIIAIAVSTTNTIIWYDHHEDGYEVGYKNNTALSPTTQIWGDGNCDNGYAFGKPCTKPSDDVLVAGQSIVLENTVDIRSGANNGIKFDGGDKILASYPIAITRGAYPNSPGSLMAGAVEVLDTIQWGTLYVSPAGQNVYTPTGAFRNTALYIMAKEDGTTVTTSDGGNYTLNMGDSVAHIVKNAGITVTATFPVQVDILAGDIDSNYELRWFALFPRSAWTNSYFSPVGDTVGACKILLYNPASDADILVTVTHSDATNANGSRKYPLPYNVTVRKGTYAFTNVVESGTGAELTSSRDFIALSLTDTATSGQVYDWGFPVLPSNKLTEKVLVGWGYGCTGKRCDQVNSVGGLPRSVVWVSPWETADIYVDIDNDGIPEPDKTVKGALRLSSHIIENGVDLSGAVIWAVKPNEPHNSTKSVSIAAAWGQNSAYSYAIDPYALDLGTLVPPFIGVRVDEFIDLAEDKDGDGMISPGDVVEYTIQVQNAGQKDYKPCNYKIKDPGLPINLPRQTYVPGTCLFSYEGREQSCDDVALSGGDGLCSLDVLPMRGGVHYYKFKATVGPPSAIDEVDISNQGVLTQVGLGPVLPFSVPEVIHFRPSVNIEKTVFLGTVPTCSNGQELVEGRPGNNVTYCFQVTNTGNSYLDYVVVTDPENGMLPISTIPFMAPGDVVFVKYETTMPRSPITTNATVTAIPTLVNRKSIASYQGGNVTDLDDAGVKPDPYDSSITIKKYAGPPGSACNITKMADDIYLATDLKFEYCYIVSSTGDECVVGAVLTDSALGGASQNISKLCPGDSPITIVGPVTTSKTDVPSTNATVTGTGEYSGAPTNATDAAGIDVPDYKPTLSIKKYAGQPGSSCNLGNMVDDIYQANDLKFEYCYIITNSGNECVVGGTLSDSALGGVSQSISKLCPGDTPITVVGPVTNSTTDILSTDATVAGTGEYSGLSTSASDPAGINVPDLKPTLTIKKYAGPPGSSCNITAMEDDTFVATNLKFEYCYIITNTGNECVVGGSLSDSAIGGVAQNLSKLCPGDSPLTIVGPETTSKIPVPPTNATVTGTGEYSGSPTTSGDPASVDIPAYNPALSIKKYAGASGSGCNIVAMADDTYVAVNNTFEYCYVITNAGTECIVDIVLSDTAVGGIPSQSLAKICPGSVPILIRGPITPINASVPSTNVNITGSGEYSGTPVKAQDPAAVEYVKPSTPGITIEKTVHLGNLPTCSNGRELEYGYLGTVVTYCYEVKNTGDVVLNVVVTDGPVGTSESFPLPPGSTKFVKMISSITTDLESPGVAVGTPVDGGTKVEDSDPAGVKLVPVKPLCE